MTTLAVRIAARPRRALLWVFFFVLLAGVFGGPVAGALDSSGGFTTTDSDSAVAIQQIEEATGRAPSPGVVLLVDLPQGLEASAGRVEEVAAQLAAQPGIVDVVAATYPRAGAALVSTDGSQGLIVATLDADADEAVVAEGVLGIYEDADDVAAGGQAITGFQIGETLGQDLARGEALALPILVLLSVIFFGGRAALMPLMVGVTTVLGTFLALSGINQGYGLSVFALNLVIGLGLGLAIDYTLFLLARYREELTRQGPTTGAIVTTMATAGRTVAYSALTVAVALITLTVFPLGFLKSMGIAGAVVAVIAAAAALVISPAVFGLWGAKLTRRSRRSGSRVEEDGRWYRFSQAVMRRPGVVAAATAVVMIALAAPAVRADWTPIDSSVIPLDQSSRTVADTLAEDFAGAGSTPLTIAVRSTDAASVASYATQVNALDGVLAPAEPVALDRQTWQLDVGVTGAPEGEAAQQLVADVRALDASVEAHVAGPAANFVDQQQDIGSRLPLALGLLLALTLLVLWLMTGSVVRPVQAVVMNALTVGSALGALTFIYQDGRLTGFLGYTSNGGIEPTNFLVVTALVFALSTDYGVFLLGRIKESRESGESERESVAIGLQRTGGVVTAAAILLAVAIGAFSTSSISFIQQVGVATAFGVLVDAFIVRSLLVPALMGLLGKSNWWAPRPLRRLHDLIDLGERELPTLDPHRPPVTTPRLDLT